MRDELYNDADVAQGEYERQARLAERCKHEDTYLPDLESIYSDPPDFLRGLHKCVDCGTWIDPKTGKRL